MPDAKNITRKLAIEPERLKFRELLVSNANYFGNVIGSKLKAVKKIITNTNYEELKCVGLYPEFDLLEAIVYIKRDSGYGGGICAKGTPEFVRFYLSYDNGASWDDQGVTSFNAQDIPGTKPLEYAVQLKIKPKKRLCTTANLPKVRAILSWNVQPPANMPNYNPVWGNVVDGRVQIDPFKLILQWPVAEVLKQDALVSILKENNIIPQETTKAELKNFDLDTLQKEVLEGMSKAGEADVELTVPELQELYADKKVEVERYVSPVIHKMSLSAASLPLSAATLKKEVSVVGLDIDISKVIGALLETDGNTSYEELGCVGLDVTTDMLEATIKVKRPFGYLGGLCKKGSREYVAFWMDFGGGWEYVGTTSVRVHDIANMPPEGLDYAVSLPVNLADRRQPCQKGPKLARVRAVMSWETLPDPNQPNQIPFWGNRKDTNVVIPPGQIVPPDTHLPFIETVGGMAVSDIDASGYASGAAVTAGFTANDSPFAGEVVIAGHLAYPTDISSGAAPLEYRVLTSNDGGATWQTVANSFLLHRTQLLNGIWTTLPVINQAAPGGWYEYREDLSAGPSNAQIFVSGNILARWQTSAPMDGPWLVKIESRVKGTVGPVWTSASVAAMLDNVAPNVSIGITTGGGACADFNSGTVISGPYSALDDHFSSYSLQIVPAGGGTFTVNPSGGGSFSSPSPLSRAYPAVPDTGETGTWELDTTGIPQCGYVIYLHAWDRSIVNSGYVGLHNSAVVGLCIRGSS